MIRNMPQLAVDINNLTKTYRSGFKREQVKAVDRLSLSIQKGSVMGLIGPNGAGKTTTIYCMLGLLIPDSGSISLLGEPPRSKKAHKRMGFQSEIFHTHEFLKPEKVLEFYGRLSGMEEASLQKELDYQLGRLGLNHARDQKVKSFSKGMKQRLGIAQALIHDPDLLILDEPFTGLDPEGRSLIADIVEEEKEKGKTIFFSSHILSDIERLCDKVTMIQKGEVVLSGNMKDITSTKDRWIIKVTGWKDAFESKVNPLTNKIQKNATLTTLICGSDNKKELLQYLMNLPVDIVRIRPQTKSLEELYLQIDEEGANNA